MSAAAGISAAKKRRGVIQTTPESSKQQQPQQQSPVMITPIQILQNHELRLKAIEQQLIVTEETTAEIKSTVVAKSKESPVVQPQQPVVAVLPPAQIEEFSKLKTKCESLEKKVDELTNLVNKVQSFSIESNLALLRLKRNFDEDIENRIQDLKQNYVSNESMISTVKQETAAALSSMTAAVSSENIHLNVIEQ